VPKKIRFTDLALRSLPFSDRQVTYWDATFPAFGLRVGKRSKTFIVVRKGGYRMKVGTFPAKSLQDARKDARRSLYELAHEPAPLGIAATQALTLFIESRAQKNKVRTYRETMRLLDRHLRPILGTRLLPQITTDNVAAVTDSLSDTPAEANHFHTAAKTFFNWTVSRRYIKHSPMAGLAKPAKASERDHVITDKEMARIYRAATELGHPYGFICLIAIHTGMRRGEVGALEWSFISPETITLPPALTKNKREHVLPNLMAHNLALVPRKIETIVEENGEQVERTCKYLFPSSVGTSYSAWSDGKEALDALCRVDNFVFHDFRRYLSTTMAKLRVPIDVTETILNHISGSRSPIQRIYDRHDRLPEMREALALYEKHLAALISSH
jgi:integrase